MNNTELFTYIWNNAYDTYAETDDALMWDYLNEQIRNGNITREDAEVMAEDIIETYNV